jgi:hypothetical protein
MSPLWLAGNRRSGRTRRSGYGGAARRWGAARRRLKTPPPNFLERNYDDETQRPSWTASLERLSEGVRD